MPIATDRLLDSTESPRDQTAEQDRLFVRATEEFTGPIARLARAHEADPALCADLCQEIHLALWRSFASFDQRCSLRTWVYRVAHNVAATHVLRRRRRNLATLVSIDDIDIVDTSDMLADLDASRVIQRLDQLIQALKPMDRQLIILHLEGVPAEDIAEIAGISLANTHTKLHRIREVLASKVNAGDRT